MRTIITYALGRHFEFDLPENISKANSKLQLNTSAKFLFHNFTEHYKNIRFKLLICKPSPEWIDNFIEVQSNGNVKKFISMVGWDLINERVFEVYMQEQFDKLCDDLVNRMRELEI